MTVVKELNELAKKMTRVNPGAKTDAQALNYIEQNYTSDGETFAIVQTKKSKFDYVIPAGLYEDVTGAITDEDIISVLEEIDDNYLDGDGKIKPLTIGIYLGNNEQSMKGYFSSCVQIGSAGGHIILNFVSNVDYSCMVKIYYSSGWEIGSSAI